nr:cadherin-like domain-containing protein [Aeromicrobium senzhongii]
MPVETVPSRLTCVGPADRALGSIRAVKAPNVAPRAPRTVKVVTKKNKAKNFVIRAKDANGDRLTYKVGKVKKKAGKVSGKGPKFKFKPKKNFKGKTAFYVSVRDGKGGSARVKVIVTVKKK